MSRSQRIRDFYYDTKRHIEHDRWRCRCCEWPEDGERVEVEYRCGWWKTSHGVMTFVSRCEHEGYFVADWHLDPVRVEDVIWWRPLPPDRKPL